MGLVWYLWPINVILGATVMVALAAGLWMLGYHIRRVFQARGDGLRMRDLINLNLQIEDIEYEVRSFCDRQQHMLDQLRDLVELAHQHGSARGEDRAPR